MLRLALGCVLVAPAACGGAPEGTPVEARLDVHVTDTPLGDVVLDELGAGDSARAQCLVERALSNAGVPGSAIRITVGRTTGYAAVTTSPDDPAARRPVFDLDEAALRRALPPCPGGDG